MTAVDVTHALDSTVLIEIDGERLSNKVEVLAAVAPWDDVQVRVTKPITRRQTKEFHGAYRSKLAERADLKEYVILTDAARDPATSRVALAVVTGEQQDVRIHQHQQEPTVKALELQAILFAIEKLKEKAGKITEDHRGKEFTIFTDSLDDLKALTGMLE